MRIEHVEGINLFFEYPEAQRFTYAGGVCTGRVTTVVRVVCEDGRIGYGSAYTHPGMAHLTINGQLAPLLRGDDPREVEALWDKMYGVTRWYGRKGAAMTALGGIDTALWDLRAQDAGQPLWKLFGGGTARCPAYASGLLWSDTESLAREATTHIENGFRRVKMRLSRSEEYDTEAVRAVRRAIGADNDMLVDASMRYTPTIAKRMGDFFAEHGVFWYEEPFAPEDIDAYTGLRGTVGVPLAAGENEFGFQGFRELARAGAVDILQPDASRCGGLSEVRRVCDLAAEHGLKAATHSWSDALAIVANAHAIAAAPAGITVEIDRTGNPFVEELLGTPLAVEDGQIDLGEAPGLGVEVNEAVIERHRMADPLAMPEGSFSDMMFGTAFFPPSLPFTEKTSS